MDEPIKRPRTEFLCELPLCLGKPIGMDLRGGRILIETESGIPLIAPIVRNWGKHENLS